MTDPFLARLVVAFVVGGGTVALFTWAAERLGSRVGGLLLSFPVKVAITLVLVAATDGAELAARAAASAPGGLAANVLFLGVAVLLLRAGRSLAVALAAGLAAWLLGAVAVVVVAPASLGANLAAFAVAAALVFAVLNRDRAHRGSARQKPKPGRLGILGRALFAGVVVSAAVLSTHLVGPAFGGVMSVFPSGFLTSLVILHRAHGSAFTGQTARTMVAGLLAPALYLVVVAISYPTLLVAPATLLAIGLAAATSGAVGGVLGWVDRRVASTTG